MKPNEAADLVTLLAAATSTRLLPQEVEVWQEQFLPLDADLATRTVHRGRQVWGRFPAWRDFRELYFMLKREHDGPVGEQRSDLPPAGKRGYSTPEWVWVWTWSVFSRSPRNLRPFPQQKGFVDDALIMPEEEYEKLRDEWVAAGRPKPRHPIPTITTKEVA